MSEKFTAGDEVLATEQNQIWRGGSSVDGLLAGETINGATLPVPIYQNTTDYEFYACDANDTNKLEFVGFAISNSTNGNSIDIQFEGIVKGFTGLTRGVKYYVQNTAGTIGTTQGTYAVLVGAAISTTEIIIINNITSRFNSGGEELIGLDSDQNISNEIYQKKKDAKIHRRGRLKVDHRIYSGTLGVSILSKIYVNDIAVGNEHTTPNSSTVIHTDYITIEPGDNVQLYCKKSTVGGSGSTPYVRYMKIYVEQFDGATSVLD